MQRKPWRTHCSVSDYASRLAGGRMRGYAEWMGDEARCAAHGANYVGDHNDGMQSTWFELPGAMIRGITLRPGPALGLAGMRGVVE